MNEAQRKALTWIHSHGHLGWAMPNGTIRVACDAVQMDGEGRYACTSVEFINPTKSEVFEFLGY